VHSAQEISQGGSCQKNIGQTLVVLESISESVKVDVLHRKVGHDLSKGNVEIFSKMIFQGSNCMVVRTHP
jgi:hypothetical protein